MKCLLCKKVIPAATKAVEIIVGLFDRDEPPFFVATEGAATYMHAICLLRALQVWKTSGYTGTGETETEGKD